MSFYPNAVLQIDVQDRDGVSKGILAGKVEIEGGDGLRITSEGDEITMDAGESYSDIEAYYRRKFRVIVDGGTFIDRDGIPLEFSGMPYYIASIAGQKGNFLENFDFLSSPCGQVGIFYDGTGEFGSQTEFGSAGGAVGDGFVSMLNGNGELELLDICQACVDCEDYQQIIDLMDRIELFQNWDVKRNLNDETEGGELALFHQYQATVHYWNYLVHVQCVPIIGIRGSDYYGAINTGYFLKQNITLSEIKQDIAISITWAGPVGDVKILLTNTMTRGGAGISYTVEMISDTQFVIHVKYDPMSYNEYVFFQFTVRTTEKMGSMSASSTWCNTHLTLGRDGSDAPGDQCVTRGVSVI